MAKVVITLEDATEPGGVHVHADFDPPMSSDAPRTAAQYVAAQMLGELLDDELTDGQTSEVH